MGRIGKLKREAIQEANKRNLGIIDENQAGFSLGFANNGGLTIQEDEVTETTLSQEFNDDNEGDKEEVDTDQIEEQDDVPLDEIT